MLSQIAVHGAPWGPDARLMFSNASQALATTLAWMDGRA
jgi:hypothetical protein